MGSPERLVHAGAYTPAAGIQLRGNTQTTQFGGTMAQSRENRQGTGARDNMGQQSGSKRPAAKTGAAKAAPKKGTVEPKGTAREAAPKKTRPE
jgi:hypothetical protein